MSFLNDLAAKRKQLKPTNTKITTVTGVQYEEPSSRVYQSGAGKQSFTGRPPDLVLTRPPSSPGFVVDNKPDLLVGHVTDHLIIGSADAAMDCELLRKHQVTHILTVAPLADYRPPLPQIKHLYLNVLDLPDTELSQYYERAFLFLDEAAAAEGVALVHCNAGVSRSAAITLAYIMKSMNLSYEAAFNLVKEKRPHINPNIGFIIQLKNYEKQLAASV